MEFRVARGMPMLPLPLPLPLLLLALVLLLGSQCCHSQQQLQQQLLATGRNGVAQQLTMLPGEAQGPASGNLNAASAASKKLTATVAAAAAASEESTAAVLNLRTAAATIMTSTAMTIKTKRLAPAPTTMATTMVPPTIAAAAATMPRVYNKANWQTPAAPQQQADTERTSATATATAAATTAATMESKTLPTLRWLANTNAVQSNGNTFPHPNGNSNGPPAATEAATAATGATSSAAASAGWPVKHAAVLEGDVILGGLMMVHSREDSITCGQIMPQGGIQALEAMLYTLDQVNKQQLLPNVTLGAHLLDDCDKDTYGLEMAVDFIKDLVRMAEPAAASSSRLEGAVEACSSCKRNARERL